MCELSVSLCKGDLRFFCFGVQHRSQCEMSIFVQIIMGARDIKASKEISSAGSS